MFTITICRDYLSSSSLNFPISVSRNSLRNSSCFLGTFFKWFSILPRIGPKDRAVSRTNVEWWLQRGATSIAPHRSHHSTIVRAKKSNWPEMGLIVLFFSSWRNVPTWTKPASQLGVLQYHFYSYSLRVSSAHDQFACA